MGGTNVQLSVGRQVFLPGHPDPRVVLSPPFLPPPRNHYHREPLSKALGDGLFITSCPDSIGEDTGLRFAELSRDYFRCPACGATVREPVSTAPILNKKAGKRPNVAPASSGSRRRI
jgi:hypothetical protein